MCDPIVSLVPFSSIAWQQGVHNLCGRSLIFRLPSRNALCVVSTASRYCAIVVGGLRLSKIHVWLPKNEAKEEEVSGKEEEVFLVKEEKK